jgi:hypothetical protein
MKQHLKRFVSCTITYVVILASTFYALWFIFDFFNLFYTDIDNARYLLSAMAQSQAAIIAIVITVSLVAVQLGASAYSPRVVKIFKSNPDLWVLLALYGLSISYDFIILKILSAKSDDLHIFISYWLYASAFLLLFPYILSMMNILSPQPIIRKLLEDIYVKKEWKERDPFQPIFDIVRSAFMKHDYETVEMGLRGMTAKVIKVINSYDIEKYRFIPGKQNPYNPSKDFSEFYCKHLNQIGRLFAKRDEVLTLETVENLERIAKSITEKRLGTEEKVVAALGNIGIISAQKEFQMTTEQTVGAIEIIGKRMIEEDYIITQPNRKEYLYHCSSVIRRVVDRLNAISVLAVEKWGIYMLQPMGGSLEKVGIAIAKVDIVNLNIFSVSRTFYRIGVTALNVEETPTLIGDSIVSDHVIRPLTTIGKIIAHEKEMNNCFREVVLDLWSVGSYAAERGFKRTANAGAKALAELAILDEKVVEKGLNDLKYREALGYRETEIESLPEIQKFIVVYKEHLKKLRTSKNESRKKEQHL